MIVDAVDGEEVTNRAILALSGDEPGEGVLGVALDRVEPGDNEYVTT